MTIPSVVQYFEKINADENESKFWAFRFEPAPGSSMAMRAWWGRIGTKGQTKAWVFATDRATLAEARVRTEAKLREGYRQIKGDRPASWPRGWAPEFVGQSDRAPTIPGSDSTANAWAGLMNGFGRDPDGINEDGWLIVNGRAQRPSGRRPGQAEFDRFLRENLGEMNAKDDADESVARTILTREVREDRKKSDSKVEITTDRVIDFEE